MRHTAWILILPFAFGLGLTRCSGSKSVPATSQDYVVFAWNDLGMHCLNPTYDEAIILPPYNTVWAQVVRRGNPPEIVTEGMTVEYRIVDNTYSYGKTDAFGGDFAQFWDNSAVFGAPTLAHDTGLNLVDADIHNGLSGTMLAKGDHFQVNGIPVVPVDDAGGWNPYQVAEVTVKSGSTVVATTRATVPTSDEINCAKCHDGSPGHDAFYDLLSKHDAAQGTTLLSQMPVLCASCHGSPALGQSGPGSSGKYLSQAIHGFHADKSATCLDCHPGATTKCSRSLAHTASDGNCTTCHGSMTDVAGSIEVGSRIPWENEPKCATCHTGVAEVDTGSALYRNAKGHGDIYCASCHGSPHAMVPSREDADNYQAVQYQGKAVSIGSCVVCHNTSKGEGSEEFAEEHGGAGGKTTACRVCHTQLPASFTVAQWPHQFQWKAR